MNFIVWRGDSFIMMLHMVATYALRVPFIDIKPRAYPCLTGLGPHHYSIISIAILSRLIAHIYLNQKYHQPEVSLGKNYAFSLRI